VNAAPTEPDDEPLEACYRHPDRPTALHCITCERPICTDCAVIAAVGQKCPDCAKQPRSARAAVPVAAHLRGALVGAVASAVAGYLYWQVPIPIFGWIVAGLVGGAIGELVRRATGGFRDPGVARVAAVVVAVGFAWPFVAEELLGANLASGSALQLVGAAFAAYSAYQRA
jgi:hypothetical protein